MNKTIALSLLISATFVACKTPKETTSIPPAPLDCTGKVLTYAIDIKPIMEANCTKCHNTNNKAGFNFLTIESVKKAAKSGQLLGSIKHMKDFLKMPKMAPKMNQANIDKIECWINNGMRE